VVLFTVSFILVAGHLCRGADLGRWLAVAALGGFRPYLPCGGRVSSAREGLSQLLQRLSGSPPLDAGLSDSTRLAGTCAADATLVAAWGVSTARRMSCCWQLGRRRTAEIHGSAWPYLSGCLAEVFIWGPRTAASAFPRFLRGFLLLLALAAVSVFHAWRGKTGLCQRLAPHASRRRAWAEVSPYILLPRRRVPA